MLRTCRPALAAAAFAATAPRLKKSGKPLETPAAHKQSYLPFERPPSPAEVERDRRRFATCGSYITGKPLTVADVPDNMYTYGKEGMAIPGLAIFKDQPDPVIGPEQSYPGIYENKIACRHKTMEQLFAAEDKDSFDSPWDRRRLENQVGRNIRHARGRMGLLMQREYIPYSKDRAAKKGKPTTVKKGGDPDKKAIGTEKKAADKKSTGGKK